jgi:hypothetical protein
MGWVCGEWMACGRPLRLGENTDGVKPRGCWLAPDKGQQIQRPLACSSGALRVRPSALSRRLASAATAVLAGRVRGGVVRRQAGRVPCPSRGPPQRCSQQQTHASPPANPAPSPHLEVGLERGCEDRVVQVRRRRGRRQRAPAAAGAAAGAEEEAEAELRPRRARRQARARAVRVDRVPRAAAQQQARRGGQRVEADGARAARGGGGRRRVAWAGGLPRQLRVLLRERAALLDAGEARALAAQAAARVAAGQALGAGLPQLGPALGRGAHLAAALITAGAGRVSTTAAQRHTMKGRPSPLPPPAPPAAAPAPPLASQPPPTCSARR